MVQLVASFAPPGASFEAASRRLRTRWLGFTNKNRRCKGAGMPQGIFPAALGGERGSLDDYFWMFA